MKKIPKKGCEGSEDISLQEMTSNRWKRQYKGRKVETCHTFWKHQGGQGGERRSDREEGGSGKVRSGEGGGYLDSGFSKRQE